MRTRERTQTVWGDIAANGVVLSGSGDFTLQRTSVGIYVVRFRRPFAFAPAFTFHPEDGQGLPYTPVPNLTAAFVSVVFSNAYAGAAVDVRFTFSATGRIALA